MDCLDIQLSGIAGKGIAYLNPVKLELDNTYPERNGTKAVFSIIRSVTSGVKFITQKGTKLYPASSLTDIDTTGKTPYDGILPSGTFVLFVMPPDTVDVIEFGMSTGNYIRAINNNGAIEQIFTRIIDLEYYPAMLAPNDFISAIRTTTHATKPYRLKWDDIINEDIVVNLYNMSSRVYISGAFTDTHKNILDNSPRTSNLYMQLTLANDAVLDVAKCSVKTFYFNVSKEAGANVTYTCSAEPEFLKASVNGIQMQSNITLTPAENDLILSACSRKPNLSGISFSGGIKVTGGRTVASDSAVTTLTNAGITVVVA